MILFMAGLNLTSWLPKYKIVHLKSFILSFKNNIDKKIEKKYNNKK